MLSQGEERRHQGVALFSPFSDRRMEWSPVWHPSCSSWLHQWLCVSCSRTVQTSEIGDIHQLPCAQCGVLSHMVIDCSSGERWPWCQQCQCRIDPLQTKVAIGFLTGLLRVQVGCMGGEKGQSPHQVRAHSLGFFALSSHWH